MLTCKHCNKSILVCSGYCIRGLSINHAERMIIDIQNILATIESKPFHELGGYYHLMDKKLLDMILKTERNVSNTIDSFDDIIINGSDDYEGMISVRNMYIDCIKFAIEFIGLLKEIKEMYLEYGKSNNKVVIDYTDGVIDYIYLNKNNDLETSLDYIKQK